MARDISELGADVFDDTLPQGKNKKMSTKKKNNIIGFSCFGVGILAIAATFTVLSQTVLKDFDTIPYLSFYYNTTDGKDNGTATISMLLKEEFESYPKNFRIPGKINGHKVTRIDEKAFNDCTLLESVTMTDNIEYIGPSAFKDCTNLKKFKFSKHLSYVGSKAFEGTEYEKTLPDDGVVVLNNEFIIHVGKDYFKEDVILLQNEDSVIPEGYTGVKTVYFTDIAKKPVTGFMDACFSDNDKIRYVELPSTLTNLADEVFYDCTNLECADLSRTNITALSGSAFANCTSLSELKLADNMITTIGDYCFEGTKIEAFPDGLEKLSSVGIGVFKNCVELETFTYPSALKSIPNETFEGCSSLAEFHFTDDNSDNISSIGSKAFKGTAISSFKMPKNVITLRDSVFADCPNLRKVSMYNNPFGGGVNDLIPVMHDGKYDMYQDEAGDYRLHYENEEMLKYYVEGMTPIIDTTIDDDDNVIPYVDDETNELVYYDKGTLIGIGTFYDYAFDGSENFDTISLYDDDGNDIPGKSADGEINIPSTVESTSSAGSDGNTGYTFTGTKLTKVNFNKYIKTIGNNMFEGVSTLEEANFEEGSKQLSTIGDYAFKGTSIGSINIPDSVKTIGVSAFEQCGELTTVHLPENPKDPLALVNNAFNNCAKLETINFPNQLTKCGDYSFHGTSIKEAIFKQNLGTISPNSFSDCAKLETVDLSATTKVKEISKNAFSNDIALSNVKLGKSVATISSKAFAGCTSLTNIVIPSATSTISADAFQGCTGLNQIFCEAATAKGGWASGWNQSANYYLYSETEKENCWHYVSDVPTLW